MLRSGTLYFNEEPLGFSQKEVGTNKNCPIDSTDVSNARAIFGPDLASVRRKTVRRNPKSIVEKYGAVPKELVSRNKFISMAADVFFVDGIAFLLTVVIKIKFVTVEHTPVRTAKSLVKHIKLVLQVYNRAVSTVRYMMMDGEFEKVKELLPTILCNTTDAK